MARSRNIKPGFFANEALAECGPWARLCFAGLWTLADREGRLEDRPKRIKGELFRFDAIEVEPLLDELAAHGFLLRYSNEDGRFLQILAFAKHQTPHYSERPSSIKPPVLQESSRNLAVAYDDDLPRGLQESTETPPGVDQEHSRSSPGVDPSSRGGRNPLIPDSGFLIPDSSSLRSENVAASRFAQQPPTSPIADELRETRDTPLPVPMPLPPFNGANASVLNGKAIVALAQGFELPDDWGLDAEALGWRPSEVLHEAERFRQYWTVGKGAGKRRSVRGWRQSWSTWLKHAETQVHR